MTAVKLQQLIDRHKKLMNSEQPGRQQIRQICADIAYLMEEVLRLKGMLDLGKYVLSELHRAADDEYESSDDWKIIMKTVSKMEAFRNNGRPQDAKEQECPPPEPPPPPPPEVKPPEAPLS